jgi:hypothetical protein
MNTDGIAYLFFFKNWKYFIFQIELIAANGFGLGEEADFEALNCQPSTKVDTR